MPLLAEPKRHGVKFKSRYIYFDKIEVGLCIKIVDDYSFEVVPASVP